MALSFVLALRSVMIDSAGYGSRQGKAVAHCIAGMARVFPERSVHESLFRAVARLGEGLQVHNDFFYVMDLDSRSDSKKGGTYNWSFADLQPAFNLMPPVAFITNTPLPQLRQDECPKECLPMFSKLKLCLRALEMKEEAQGFSYDWVIRHRPDLQWTSGLEPGPLSSFSALCIWILYDMFAILPRSKATHFLSISESKCPSRMEVHNRTACPELPDVFWGCSFWHCHHLRSLSLPFAFLNDQLENRYRIVRPADAAKGWATGADAFGDYAALLQPAMMKGNRTWRRNGYPLLEATLQGDRPKVSPLADIQPGQFCIDQTFCLQRHAFLGEVLYKRTPSVGHLLFGVWRPATLLPNEYVLVAVAESKAPVGSYYSSSYQKLRHLLFQPPLRIAAGDCLSWISVREDPGNSYGHAASGSVVDFDKSRATMQSCRTQASGDSFLPVGQASQFARKAMPAAHLQIFFTHADQFSQGGLPQCWSVPGLNFDLACSIVYADRRPLLAGTCFASDSPTWRRLVDSLQLSPTVTSEKVFELCCYAGRNASKYVELPRRFRSSAGRMLRA